MALSDVLGLLAGSFGAGLSEYGAQQTRTAELERKRAEEERIRKATEALFGGGELTPERAGAAITAGVSPTVLGSAQMFGRRMDEPTYEERRENGGVAIYENGRFKSWKVRPPSEREPSTRGTISQTQIGEGLSYLNNWLNQPVSLQEKARRERLFRSLRDNPQYRTAPPGEIGYYIKQAETSRLPASGLADPPPPPPARGAPGATLSERTSTESGRPR